MDINYEQLPAEDDSQENRLSDCGIALTPDEEDQGNLLSLDIDPDDDWSDGVTDEEDGDEIAAPTDLRSAVMSPRDIALGRARVLRECLIRNGVPQVSIELQIGRPTTLDQWNACKPIAVMSHHIASHPTVERPTPGLHLVKVGRSDLPGPLCNGYAGMDLIYRIICMGYANHAGLGGAITVEGPMGTYLIPKDNGRPYIWGTEFEGGYSNDVWDRQYRNAKTGMKMTYREFMGRVNAGLTEGIWSINGRGRTPLRRHDLSTYHMEHSTWAPQRKVDRMDYTTWDGRKEIRTYDQTKVLPKVDLSLVQRVAVSPRIEPTLPSVKRVQRALNERLENRTALKVDGVWGDKTALAYKAWQRKIGAEKKDGKPRRGDLKRLGEGYFRVVE